VRASTGGATSRTNCHPFVAGRWSFMHNGQIGGFERLRCRLESEISDDLYDRLNPYEDFVQPVRKFNCDVFERHERQIRALLEEGDYR
jgi:predicted glutamine amidotransferase